MGSVLMRVFVVSVVCLLLSLPLMLADTTDAAPNPIPFVVVDTSLDIYEVRALPHTSTQVIIDGNVTVEKYCGGRVTIRLRGETDCGWPFSVYPSTIPYINPGTQKFHVFVTIPPGVSPEGRDLTITATGKSPGLSQFMSTTMCTIIPSSIYTNGIESMGSPCVVGEDGAAKFPIRIWNTGNVPDVYTVDLLMDRTAIESWDGPVEVMVPPRSFVETNITMNYIEPRYPTQIWSADLSVRSSLADGHYHNTIVYVGGPSSTNLWVFDTGPQVAPILGIDLAAGVTTTIIIIIVVIAVAATYQLRRKA